jgi:hypothetical protein
MSTGGEPGHLHRNPDGTPGKTCRNRYQYFFYDKHHGRGGKGDARWAENLSEVEEFGIFDMADEHDLLDEAGHLYGLWIGWSQSGRSHQIFELGTREQVVALFWRAPENQPWHGFPLWPIKDPETPNRSKQQPLPPKSVFKKMEGAGLLTERDRRRLQKGKHL